MFTVVWIGANEHGPVVSSGYGVWLIRLDVRDFDSRPSRLMGCVTASYISPSHPGLLSLLPSAGREVSNSQSAVMLCGWGVKTGWLILSINVWAAGKL